MGSVSSYETAKELLLKHGSVKKALEALKKDNKMETKLIKYALAIIKDATSKVL